MSYHTIYVKKNKKGPEIAHCGELIFQWFGALADVKPEMQVVLLRNEAFEDELDARIVFQTSEPLSAEEFADIVFEEEKWYPDIVRVLPAEVVDEEYIVEVLFNGVRVY
jgi:hypothetical protein